MSISAVEWAFKQTGLRSSVKFVLVALADRANDDGECWPSREVIAADTCLNPETVSKATEELVALGLLEKRRRFASSVVFRLVGFAPRHLSAGNPAKGKNPPSFSGKSRHPSAGNPAPNLSLNLSLNRKSKSACADEPVYAFTGETVRVTRQDFDKLASQYPNLDLSHELPQLDLELRGQRKWWHALNSKLNYRNKAHGNGNRLGSDTGPDRSAAGRVRANAKRELAALATTRTRGDDVAVDVIDVRPSMDIRLRR